MPLNHLLAATDLSAPSRHAVERSAMIAREVRASLSLVHVMSGPAMRQLSQLMGLRGDECAALVAQEASQALSLLATEVGTAFGLQVGTHIATGNVLPVIVQHAEQLRADMLVLGSQGQGFMRNMLLGTTSERLLRLASQPLLVVKQRPHDPYRSVLVPVDFSDYSQVAVQMATQVAPGARITLLHAFEVPFEGALRLAGVDDETLRQARSQAASNAGKALHQLAAMSGLPESSYQVLAVHGEASAAIVAQEEELGADLIVVGKHGVDVVQELLLGSVTKHVVGESRSDVLVAR